MSKYGQEETQQHLAELAKGYIQQASYCNGYGYGAWNVDEYRPFGNSMGVRVDILECCGIEPEGSGDGDEYYSDEQKEYADRLYKELLGPFLRKAIEGYCNALALASDCKQAQVEIVAIDRLLETLGAEVES